MKRVVKAGQVSYLNIVLSLLVAAYLGLFQAGLTVLHAQGEEGVKVFFLRQEDTNGDGRPDVTIIDCSFATELDRVTIYDHGGDMKPFRIDTLVS